MNGTLGMFIMRSFPFSRNSAKFYISFGQQKFLFPGWVQDSVVQWTAACENMMRHRSTDSG